MTKIHQLQAALKFFYWVTILALAASSIMFALMLLPGESFIDFEIKDVVVKVLTPDIILLIILGIGAHVAFIVAIHHFRKLISLFIEKKFFDTKSTRILRNIGKLLFVTGILSYLPRILLPLLSISELRIAISADHESFFFLMIISLFFYTLSFVFDEARKMKEENELTV